MKGFTEACQLYVALIVFGIFFGQLYFAEFQVGSTMAGVAGLVIGSVGVKWVQVSLSRAGLVVGLCVVGLVGVGIDAFEYYSKHNVPGNDFAWFLKAPYCTALLFLSFPALQRMLRRTS